jgi:hypothetical protein
MRLPACLKCGEKIVEDLGDEDARAVEKGALRRSELLFQLTRVRYATENELGAILSFRTAGSGSDSPIGPHYILLPMSRHPKFGHIWPLM